MARPAFIALLAVAVVALAACGSSDDSADSRSDVSTTSGVIAPQGTTSVQGGATGATSTKRAHRKRTGKSQQQSDDKRGVGGSHGTSRPAGAAALVEPRATEGGRAPASQAGARSLQSVDARGARAAVRDQEFRSGRGGESVRGALPRRRARRSRGGVQGRPTGSKVTFGRYDRRAPVGGAYREAGGT